jgi:hypothetical protein
MLKVLSNKLIYQNEPDKVRVSKFHNIPMEDPPYFLSNPKELNPLKGNKTEQI